MLTEYISLYMYLIVSLIIALVMIGIPYILVGQKNKSKYKAEPYECGSIPFQTPRKIIHYKFYLVAILFLIFEVEICFLLPWVIGFEKLGQPGFITMIIFFGLLSLGFIYELRKGVLDWD